MMCHQQPARNRGQLLAETAASMVLLLALGIIILFATCSLTCAYLVRGELAEASRYAARELAIAYGVDPLISQSRADQELQVFDKIRFNNVIVSSEQFDDPVFNTSAGERRVTVTVRYEPGRWGLNGFPLPDPVNLRIEPMVARSTYRLE